MAEYVTLVATSVSIKLKMTMLRILDGTIEHFEYECKSDKMKEIDESGGGMLQKKVPLPKNTHVEADKRFIASLDDRQMQLKNIYDHLSRTKNGDSLVT